MQTILVADDNSNIQKMVTLAVKGMGVDVVAVGNGESAVRKLSEFKPDLVLADIFMPVRSGYEVCEFVKHEPDLAHIPVVLLAGAFDPFDEREAQRVGADGVLKKPFVPPDPLLAMIKALLGRAPVAVESGTVAEEQAPTATAPHPPATPTSVEMAPQAPAAPTESVAQEEFVEEFAIPAPALSDEVAEKFGLRRDFSAPAGTDEEQEPSPGDASRDGFHSWRDKGGVDTSYTNETKEEGSEDRYWEREAPTLARHDESAILREAGFAEENEPVATPSAPPAAREETTTPSHPEDSQIAPAASREPPLEPAAPHVSKFVSALVRTPASISTEKRQERPAQLVPVVAVSLAPTAAADPGHAPAPDASKDNGELSDPVAVQAPDPEFESKAQKAPSHAVAGKREVSTEATDPRRMPLPAEKTAAFDSFATAPEAASPESTAPVPTPLSAQKTDSPNEPANYVRDSVQKFGVSTPPDPALVSAIVNTVLEEMRPQILDIVTREILHPVIEAMVRREFDKSRKS